MAQLSNFEIPARLSFRPYKASWAICSAEIVGWWDEPKNALRNMFRKKNAPPHDAVMVRFDVFAPEIHSVPDPGRSLAISCLAPFTYTAEIHRANIPCDVWRQHENRRNTPDIEGRNFEMLACLSHDFQDGYPVKTPGGPSKDAWDMRREYFDLECKSGALCGFLNRWGLWNGVFHYLPEIGTNRRPYALVHPHRFWEQREKFRSALAGRPRAWLPSASPLKFTSIKEPPYFSVDRSFCEDAIRATISIDHLSEAKFGICKLKDCRRLFERTSAQRRIYCSPEHAHLANVRKLRSDKKKLESKGRKNAAGKNQRS